MFNSFLPGQPKTEDWLQIDLTQTKFTSAAAATTYLAPTLKTNLELKTLEIFTHHADNEGETKSLFMRLTTTFCQLPKLESVRIDNIVVSHIGIKKLKTDKISHDLILDPNLIRLQKTLQAHANSHSPLSQHQHNSYNAPS